MRNQQKLRSKLAGALALGFFAIGASTPTWQAMPMAQAAAAGGWASVQLDGQPLATSVAPQVHNGRTLVPMRDIFEALGATVVWDNATREIRAQKGEQRIWLKIGNRQARVGDNQLWLEEAPRVYLGSTLVPLRFVAEALGAEVNWNGEQRLVSISTTHDLMANNPTTYTDVRGRISIPAGAVVPVTLDKELSSATAKVGDTFTASVKSQNPGDAEFPVGTRLQGRLTEVRRLTKDAPGVLALEFTSALLPDGSTMALQGDLVSLDDDSVNQVSTGRIMAKQKSNNKDQLKIVGIGTAAGYILGRVLDKNSILTAVLGAAGGYLYSRNKNKGEEQEAVVKAGATLGVRLVRGLSYSDAAFYDQRAPYLAPSLS